jgi:hypothetical protein
VHENFRKSGTTKCAKRKSFIHNTLGEMNDLHLVKRVCNNHAEHAIDAPIKNKKSFSDDALKLFAKLKIEMS